MGLRMKFCWSSIRFCWARGSAFLRKEPRPAPSSSSARKQCRPASSSVITRSPGHCAPRELTSQIMGKKEQDNQMRKLIFAINTTLDGCVDHTKVSADEETLEYFITLLTREADLQIFGRKTYQLMVPYWPDVLK